MPVFVRVEVELLLGEAEESNGSEWPKLLIRPLIPLKFLQEFSEAIIFGVDVESPLDKALDESNGSKRL